MLVKLFSSIVSRGCKRADLQPIRPGYATGIGDPGPPRLNRFLVLARLDESGLLVEAHLPDPGRLRELFLPGARMMLRPAEPGSTRRTAWTAVLVEVPGPPDAPPAWVSLDTGLPNRIVGQALESGALEEFAG